MTHLFLPQLPSTTYLISFLACLSPRQAVKSDSLRIWGYYWFLMCGLFVIIYGLLCHWIEHHLNSPLPLFVGLGLLLVAGFGILLDIDTGLWLVLIVAINAIAVALRANQSRQSDAVQNDQN